MINKEKEEGDDIELESVSLTPSSSSDSALSCAEAEEAADLRALYRTQSCSVCFFTATGTQTIVIPCRCWSIADEIHDTCLREIIEHTGSLCCPRCGVQYTFEPRVWTGRWNPRRVRWSMRVRGAIEAAIALFAYGVAATALLAILTLSAPLEWYVSLAIAAAAPLVAFGMVAYACCAVQMCRHRADCACYDCRLGHAPLLAGPSAGQPWLYGFFLLGVPPAAWLFGIVVVAMLIRRRARRYYARRVMEAHVVRGVVK